MVKAFHNISNWLDAACGAVCAVCVAAMVVLTGAQIVCRVAFTALDWSEELTRYLMVWAIFLGVSCMYKRMGHISVMVRGCKKFCVIVQSCYPKNRRTDNGRSQRHSRRVD
jgi:TRAP-type C4-dicarboxylate transport system permease small subunit